MKVEDLDPVKHIPLINWAHEEEKYKALGSFLDNRNIWFRYNYELKFSTYFKTGGSVLYYITPRTSSQVAELVSFLRTVGIPYRVIGFTSNILFFDELNYGVVISMVNLCDLTVEDNHIRVGAGYSLQEFVRVAILQGSGGFEGLEGIPGTVGGGIFMNAGAYGFCISSRILKVQCVNDKGQLITLNKDECAFTYRKSVFQESDLIIVAATFELLSDDMRKVYNTAESVHIARHSYQEYVYPSLGSMISFSGDMYRQMFRNNTFYKYVYSLAKIFTKNPLMKFINRKRPRNELFNKLLRSYIEKKIAKPLRFSMSVKSANTLVNDGKCSTADRLEYMGIISDIVGSEFKVENELILDATISVREDFKLHFEQLCEKTRRRG